MRYAEVIRKLRLALFAAAAVGSGLLHTGAAAQIEEWPNKPVRLVVGFAPGGSSDQIARLIALRLQDSLKVPVVVENRAGAGGNNAASFLAKAPLNDHTFMVAPQAIFAVNQYLYRSSLGFDQATDFSPVGLIVRVPTAIVVNSSLPYRSFKEFIDYAKTHPDQLNYGTSGAGASGHLLAESIQQRLSIKVTHVPYKGDGPALQGLLGGDVQFAINNNFIQNIPMIKAGRLRALAVSGPTRVPQLPDVPTLAELGYPELTTTVWFGMVAQAQMPRSNISRMNEALNAVLRNAEFAEEMQRKNFEVMPGPPAAMVDLIAKDSVHWKAVIERAKIKLE